MQSTTFILTLLTKLNCFFFFNEQQPRSVLRGATHHNVLDFRPFAVSTDRRARAVRFHVTVSRRLDILRATRFHHFGMPNSSPAAPTSYYRREANEVGSRFPSTTTRVEWFRLQYTMVTYNFCVIRSDCRNFIPRTELPTSAINNSYGRYNTISKRPK